MASSEVTYHPDGTVGSTDELPKLELESIIGFGGNIPGSLHIHPDGVHLVYALGACIVVREIGSPKSTFLLRGHTDRISCVTVSKSGNYVASGQVTHMGFQADICVFDFHSRTMLHRMILHKVKVQALAFSSDDTYLASVGGQDDNTLVVWDLSTGRPVCGGPASSSLCRCMSFFNNSNERLITGGDNVLRVWEVDIVNRKIKPTDVNIGNLRRDCRTLVVEKDDFYAYVGTGTGDVLCIQLQGPNIFKMLGPKVKLPGGILSTTLTAEGDVLVGAVGTVSVLSKIDLHVLKSVDLAQQGAVTSVTARGPHYFVGTSMSNVYYINAVTFKEELRQTCHYQRINDVCFPYGYSEVFATCSTSDIRIWHAETSQELLRIQVMNLECNCVTFAKNGSAILSGWSDGKIRAFLPQSGRLLFVVNDAHKISGIKPPRVSAMLAGVTALCVDHGNQRLMSGGADGQVRVWKVSREAQTLVASMKEHKTTVNVIIINKNDTQAISASDDGSCIVWDLLRYVRRNILYAQTYFKAVSYFVDESQILTTGSDKKVAYWDAADCQAIRELEGSLHGELLSLALSPDGETFVTGGGDKMVKLWNYDEGVVKKVGVGHSCTITKVAYSPNGRFIVSVGEEGGILIWSTE